MTFIDKATVPGWVAVPASDTIGIPATSPNPEAEDKTEVTGARPGTGAAYVLTVASRTRTRTYAFRDSGQPRTPALEDETPHLHAETKGSK